MPPDPPAIVVPTGMGKDAQDWLEHHGIMSHVPTVRSSDWELSANEFIYYLTRRLGLARALSWSKALSRGTLFHILFAVYDNEKKFQIFNRAVEARMKELTDTCKALSIDGEKREKVLNRELRDAKVARAWFTAADQIKIPRKDGGKALTCTEYMKLPHFKKVGAELRFCVIDKQYPETPFVVQLDILLLNTKMNTLWIFDAKTCTGSPINRLSTVKWEFQTQHYMVTVNTLLESGKLQRALDLPADTKLGGMIHSAVAKPTIRFGTKDRPYLFTSYGKGKMTKGKIVVHPEIDDVYGASWEPIPNDKGKGSTGQMSGTWDECVAELHAATGKKPEKEFFGEPSVDLFVDRCVQWYHDECEAHPDDPPVNMNITSSEVLRNSMWLTMYADRVQYLHDLATRPAYPRNFKMQMNGARSISGELTAYSDFYVTPPSKWPEVIKLKQFIVARRDEDLEGTAESVIERQAE